MSGVLFAEEGILNQNSEIVPDIERKPTTKIIKFLMNFNEVHFLVYEHTWFIVLSYKKVMLNNLS